MSQFNQQQNLRDDPITKIRVVPQRSLQTLFQQHGNQFLKWHFLPFLHHHERSALRAACTSIKKFIPGPKFVYTKTKTTLRLYQATARLEENTGYVETQGDLYFGGNPSTVAHHLQSNVIEIYSSGTAFAALKKNGKVITWGHRLNGGDSSSVSSELQSGVIQIFGNYCAFAALKQGGKVVTWGRSHQGGDSSAVSSELQSDVTSIVATTWAFAVLKSNGKVISWGSRSRGGDSSHLASLNNGVIKLEAICVGGAREKFRATKSDGSIIEWP